MRRSPPGVRNMRTRVSMSMSMSVLVSLVLLFAWSFLPCPVESLYEDEAGVSDFLLATAGHGVHGVLYSQLTLDGRAVITSSSYPFPAMPDSDGNDDNGNDPFSIASDANIDHGCYVSSRAVDTGKLLWRRDVCSSSLAGNIQNNIRHAVFTSSITQFVYTLNDDGVLFGWNQSDGTLLFDSHVPQTALQGHADITSGYISNNNQVPRILGMDISHDANRHSSAPSSSLAFIASITPITNTDATQNDILSIHHPITGQPLTIDTSIMDSPTSRRRTTPSQQQGTSSYSSSFSITAEKILLNAKVKKSVPSGPGYNTNNSPAQGRFLDWYHDKHTNKIHLIVAWVYNSNSKNNRNNKNNNNMERLTMASNLAVIQLGISSSSSSSSTTTTTMTFDNNNELASTSMTVVIERITQLGSLSSSVSSAPFLVSTVRIQSVQINSRSTTTTVTHTPTSTPTLLAIQPGRFDVVSIPLPIATDPTTTNSGSSGSSGSSSTTNAGETIDLSMFHPVWTSIRSILPLSANVMIMVGEDDRYAIPKVTQALFMHDGEKWVQLFNDDEEETQYDAVGYCPSGSIFLTVEEQEEDREEKNEKKDGGRALTAWKVGTERIRRRKVGGYSHKTESISIQGDEIISSKHDPVTSFRLLDCTVDAMSGLITTRSGTTLFLRLNHTNVKGGGGGEMSNTIQSKIMWKTEEGLASVASALFLDESHSPFLSPDYNEGGGEDIELEDEEVLLQKLTFASRIQSQARALVQFVRGGGGGGGGGGGLFSIVSDILTTTSQQRMKKRREYAFGLAKVAVLLSPPLNKIIAIDTASYGNVVWTKELNVMAAWHRIVHGSSSTRNGVHGIQGGVHSHEMLVVSYIPPDLRDAEFPVPAKMEWTCLDGTRGKAHGMGSISVDSPIVQLVPYFSHAHGHGQCRQLVMALHQDMTVSVVPNDDAARQSVMDLLNSGSQNGMYVHRVDKEGGAFFSFRVTPTTPKSQESNKSGSTSVFVGTAALVGQTAFSGERIVSITYPQRDEVIQSPSTTLGDDSLLLKYLNPHLCVVVTVGTEDTIHQLEQDEGWHAALSDGGVGGGSSGGEKRKKKPLGATKPGEDIPPATATAAATTSSSDTPIPSLYINVMDTVSGQILYRASHSHGTPPAHGTNVGTDLPSVVISENWIVYAYHNARTRRTDLGVLTLHEGMIDKHGITAFSSPDQEVAFTSLGSARPIVLSKTYGVGKGVTALGVTKTRGGISTKNFVLATIDDKIVSVDRRMLDPRRPSGELKESEKMEGLVRYSPLVPLIPQRTLSYTQTVHGVRKILSTSASVESQSLILAFGGPDIFFTRMAPSRGFDMLPDSFNRSLLSVVVVGLIVVTATLKRMSTKKMINLGWS